MQPEINFGDVPNDAWFAKYVKHAAKNGIISGNVATNTFSPEKQINRAEFLKMMLEVFEVDTSKFNLDKKSIDIPDDAWFAPYINFAVKFNILDQNKNNEVLPEQIVTRGEAMQILFRTIRTGNGLKVQTLLSLTEKHLVVTLELLQKSQIPASGLTITAAEKFVNLAKSMLPENNIVLGADQTTRAIKNLVGAFAAGQNGKLNDILITTGQAWKLADEAAQTNPAQAEMASAIKNLAHSLADQTRVLIKQIEAKQAENPPTEE